MILESEILQDQGDHFELQGPLPEHSIPSTLQGSLMARLDRLSSSKYVAQIGSVLGRQFSFELLQAVSQEDEVSLVTELSELVEAELIFQRGFVPGATYTFKHALVQDAAYNSLLKGSRRELHEQVADALVARSDATPPEVVAYHYTEGALGLKAIPFWEQAGQLALSRDATREAIQHLQAGLDLIAELPEEAERDVAELGFLNLLGPAVMMTKGYSNPEAEAVFARSQELCKRIDDVTPRIYSLQGLFLVYWIRSDYERALEIAKQSIQITEDFGEPGYLLMSHTALAWVYLETGQFNKARHHSEEVLRLYNAEQHEMLASLGWGHFNLSAMSCLQAALHLLGFPDAALKTSRELLVFVGNVENHVSIYSSHLWTGLLYLMRRDWTRCQEVMDAYLPLSLEFGDPFKISLSTVVRNLSLREKENEETFGTTSSILEQLHAAGFSTGSSMLLGVLAEGYLSYRAVEAADGALNDAFDHLEKNGTEFWEAEVYRLKGDILLANDCSEDKIEEWYQRALNTARGQEAKMLELRAANSLARLWKGTGRAKEAHDLVNGVLDWFTEGFETIDLIEAKELIQELGQAVER